jgi:hypothetical protein
MIGLVADGGVVAFEDGYVFGTILRLWFLRFDRAAAKPREKPETFVGFLRAFVDELNERPRGRFHEVVLDGASRSNVLARLHAAARQPNDA